MDHIRARKTSSYSQNIWHKERWWAQIFAPHSDGTLPEHLCFLIQNEAWGSILPFLQQDKIPHYTVPMRKEHTQKNLTDRSLFLILHLSLSSMLLSVFLCSQILLSSSWSAGSLQTSIFSSHPSSYNCFGHLSSIPVSHLFYLILTPFPTNTCI